MVIKIPGVNEENLQTLFLDFPMPLVLARLEGGVEFINKQFHGHYKVSVLTSSSLLQLIHQPQTSPLTTTLISREGLSVTVIVHAISLSNFTLLVFDDTTGGVPEEEMHLLHQRLAELERLSATDVLTGAWNRLPLKRTAQVEIKRSLRYHHPISLIFFDIDHFKHINDTHGHQTGDEVLKALVDLVRERIRDTDTVYRWGGEEFVIIATVTDHAAAAILAENLRQLVEAHVFPEGLELTVSLGVAEYLPGDDLEMWLHRADKAAYAAKAKGRNQVVVDPLGGSDLWRKDSDATPLQLVWHDVYSSGNQIIDGQHRKLFDTSNQLIKLALENDDHDALLLQLNLVLDAIVEHFADEEVILAELEYPGLEQHKSMHHALLRKAAVLRKEVEKGDKPVGHLLEYIAYDVLAKHILDADRGYFSLVDANEASLK